MVVARRGGDTQKTFNCVYSILLLRPEDDWGGLVWLSYFNKLFDDKAICKPLDFWLESF